MLSVVLIWQRSNPAQPSGPEGPNSLLEPKIIVPGHCKSESWLLLVEECVKTIECKVEQLVHKYQTNRLLASCIGLACSPWSGPRLDQPPLPHIPPYIYPPTPSYWEAAIFKETDSSSPPSSILTALTSPHTVIIYQHPRLRRRTRLFSQRFSRADHRITSPLRSTYDLVETKHSDPSVPPFRRTIDQTNCQNGILSPSHCQCVPRKIASIIQFNSVT